MIGLMFKAASIVEFILEAVVLIACAVAWAAVGFPRFAEVATFGGLGFVCVGIYIAMIWNKE